MLTTILLGFLDVSPYLDMLELKWLIQHGDQTIDLLIPIFSTWQEYVNSFVLVKEENC